ncbi:MAG: phosphatase PAP2 family protein [Candidatus Omnitrophota bacterium]
MLSIIIASIWFLRQPGPRQKEFLILGCVYLPLALVIFELAGQFYYNPRPFAVGGFEPLIPHKADNGFPSHHTLAAAIPAAMVFVFSRRAGYGLWALAVFTGLSRIYAGLHHGIDILGSVLIAITALPLAYFIVRRLKRMKRVQD